jgi:hypothetical protein
MLFPQVSAEEWCAKYPALVVESRYCPRCGEPRTADIPFLEKDWAGLRSSDCVCGCPAWSLSTPRSEQAKKLIGTIV